MKNSAKNNKPSKGHRLGWSYIRDGATVQLNSSTIKSRHITIAKTVVAPQNKATSFLIP